MILVFHLREDRGYLGDPTALHDWVMSEMMIKHPEAKHIVLCWRGAPICGLVRHDRA